MMAVRAHCKDHPGWRSDCEACSAAWVSDITSPVDSKTVPDDYVQDGETVETPVSEEVDQQAHLEQVIDNAGRAHLAAELLREEADRITNQGNLAITPPSGAGLLGVVVAMMQASGWKKSAAMRCFDAVWGFQQEDSDGKPETN